MTESLSSPQAEILKLTGVVERVTFHNPENGWSVLKVSAFGHQGEKLVTVVVHQAQVFAGATMEFTGVWARHPQHGEQFRAQSVLEKKPATAAALEKYLGSGLIRGVGPSTAKRIVGYFKDRTLDVFENDMDSLLRIPGIAQKKLADIKSSWSEHKAIRDVMMFLQGYGISTLFAVKIFKTYGPESIEVVSKNPYRLAQDIYGIGFFSADRIALAMGFDRVGSFRIEAGIRHVLSASREQGHCYLTLAQIQQQVPELLEAPEVSGQVEELLKQMDRRGEIKNRILKIKNSNKKLVSVSTSESDSESDVDGVSETCFYSKSLYFDELMVAKAVRSWIANPIQVDQARIHSWMSTYANKFQVQLSPEQAAAVIGIAGQRFSILTGGPGCGKTTTTTVLYKLLKAMGRSVLLAAPTGRASQRMSEVIGAEAKTIHRLLEVNPVAGGFQRSESNPLVVDFLIVDECSMLDISLAASLVKAIPSSAQVLFIGDPDQLPAVGAGNVLSDLLRSPRVPQFRLTKIFRQAEKSSIIRFAHGINRGEVPWIESPLRNPKAFAQGVDCLFLDSDEATLEQLQFLEKAKAAIQRTVRDQKHHDLFLGEQWIGRLEKAGAAGTSSGSAAVEVTSVLVPEAEKKLIQDDSIVPIRSDDYSYQLRIPEKLKHVDLVELAASRNGAEELKAALKNVHPWSTLHIGMTAVDALVHVYTKSISQWMGSQTEVQVLTPQVRGSLGTVNLNTKLQAVINPPSLEKAQVNVGDKVLRVGDRVIQTRNNYDLGVFNGDIGQINSINPANGDVWVYFSGGSEVRKVKFPREDLMELQLAYAITVHKSQGSEFPVVIIPVLSQHHNMLFRNLVYTGLTRAKKLAIFIGSRRAFNMAIQKIDHRMRQTALCELVGA